MNTIQVNNQDDDFEIETRANNEFKMTSNKNLINSDWPSEMKPHLLLKESVTKKDFIRRFHKAVEQIKDIETEVVWNKEETICSLDCVINNKKNVEIGVDFYELDGKVGVTLFKKNGNCFDYHYVRKSFLEMMSMEV